MSRTAAVLGDFALVFAGGGVGAMARYAIGLASIRMFGSDFPWGTLTVNLAGCFLIGLTVGAIDFGLIPARARPLLVTGFLGGLTTFSTYAWGLFELGRRDHWSRALLQFGLENVLGIGLVVLGFWLAETLKP
ncbi:MAG: fluoride efflux transporter CrcB [Spirochaetota bacterium]